MAVAGHMAGGAQMGGRAQMGVVESFDAQVGLGQVRSDDGLLLPFHCTQIADGSRTIAVGTRVELVVAPGQLGMWEARAVAGRHPA